MNRLWLVFATKYFQIIYLSIPKWTKKEFPTTNTGERRVTSWTRRWAGRGTGSIRVGPEALFMEPIIMGLGLSRGLLEITKVLKPKLKEETNSLAVEKILEALHQKNDLSRINIFLLCLIQFHIWIIF